MVYEKEVALGGFGNADPQTIFQIGSITKVFTALLLADLAEQGHLTLSDPAARYLPGGTVHIPSAAAVQPTLPGTTGQVTLADLATHTSGLPGLPRSLRWYALTSPRDPYARYPRAQFLRDARRALRTASPAPYAYSNFGYGVLGYLLSQAAVTPYEPLLTDRILRPLALAGTTFQPSHAPQPQTGRLAQGHRRGHPVICPLPSASSAPSITGMLNRPKLSGPGP